MKKFPRRPPPVPARNKSRAEGPISVVDELTAVLTLPEKRESHGSSPVQTPDGEDFDAPSLISPAWIKRKSLNQKSLEMRQHVRSTSCTSLTSPHGASAVQSTSDAFSSMPQLPIGSDVSVDLIDNNYSTTLQSLAEESGGSALNRKDQIVRLVRDLALLVKRQEITIRALLRQGEHEKDVLKTLQTRIVELEAKVRTAANGTLTASGPSSTRDSISTISSAVSTPEQPSALTGVEDVDFKEEETTSSQQL